MARAPGWRDEAAAALVLKHLDTLGLDAPVLVMEDPREEVAEALEARGLSPTSWHRRLTRGRPATPWPPSGPFASALLRLPRAKEELAMAAHAAASVLAPGGRLVVYGAKDEGAGSAARRLEGLFDPVGSFATGGRCRLVEGVRPETAPGLKGSLADWRVEAPPPHPELPDRPWVSYPGVFAAGRLDDATALLLESLPELPDDGPFLDFGCGDGVIGALLAARRPGAGVDLLDADAVALEAARENVPEGRVILGDGLAAIDGGRRYAAIASNPPYHEGKAESMAVIEELVAGAPGRLAAGGYLALVAQRRLPVEPLLESAFAGTARLADRGPFRVWLARG